MRPKKYTTRKDKLRTISLTDKANFFLNKIQKERPNFNFSRFVSESLINCFSDEEIWIKEQIANNSKQIDVLYRENNLLAERLRTLREKKSMDVIL